jgi:general secretion pathway protein A
MYEDHFKFIQEPFSIAPDPKFLFLSEGHNEALAHLLYGFSHSGFVLITGEVGTGKTTLLRNLLDRTPADLDVAFILNPRLTVKELLETICEELGVPLGNRKLDTVKQYIDLLNRHLLQTHQAGRSTVAIIDEAQNLSPAVLEQIRLLTNLETNEKKLLRIILLGQPELSDMLARTELRQLAQRITARFHLDSLNKSEVTHYVAHRLTKAGGNPNVFNKRAIAALYRVSKGTPRLINVVADRALLGAYVANEYRVSATLVHKAAKEVFGTRGVSRAYWIGASAVVLAVSAIMIWAYQGWLIASQDLTAAPLVRAETKILPAAPTQITQEPTTQPPAASDPNPVSSIASVPEAEPEPNNVASDPEPAPPVLTRPRGSTYQIQRNAFRTLFALWSADFDVDSGLGPCDFAPTVALQCLRRNGGWSELNSPNAPVVLVLWDDSSNPYYGVLTNRTGATYDLSLGSTKYRISARDLRDAWFGAYILLWQTPPNYSGSLRQGVTHSNVAWLRQKLTETGSDLGPSDRQQHFGPELHQVIREFQLTEGLLADGIVGPLTWIRLADRLAMPGPKLSS